MFARPLPCCLEAGEADQGHGGCDGEGPDVLQQQTRETQRSHTHLDQRGHDYGPLNLHAHMHTERRGGGGERAERHGESESSLSVYTVSKLYLRKREKEREWRR